tara:strand:- start:147 stop:542 length:396 start_codon:yes stop_codon:yes gene_type:complete
MKDIDSEPPEGFGNFEKGEFFEAKSEEAIRLVLEAMFEYPYGDFTDFTYMEELPNKNSVSDKEQHDHFKLLVMSLYNQGGGSNRNQLLAQLGEVWISHIDQSILRMEKQTDDKLEELWESEIEEPCDPPEY